MKKHSAALLASTLLTFSVAVPAHAGDAQQPSSQLTWGPCPEGSGVAARATCATFTVPKEYEDPSAGTIELTMSKVPASGQKKGVIAGNPGGPGGDALGMFSDPSDKGEGAQPVHLPGSVGKNYDLIAVEPRGLTWGTPLNCQPEITTPYTTAGMLYEACESHNSGYTKTINTENTARDLEEARKLLGEEKLNLYGLSYGGPLMSTYATLFPEHTNKAIFDSSASPNDVVFRLAEKRQAIRHEAIHEFFSWVAERDSDYHLGSTPREVYQSFAAVIHEEYGVSAPVRPQSADRRDVETVPDDYTQAAVTLVNAADLVACRTGRVVDAVKLYTDAISPDQFADPNSMVMGALYSQKSWPKLAEHLSAMKTQAADSKANTRESSDADESDNGGEPTPKEQKQQEIQQQLAQVMAIQSNVVTCNENATPPDRSKLIPYYASVIVPGDVIDVNEDMLASGAYCDGWPTNKPFKKVSGDKLKVKPLHLGYDRDTAVTGTGAPEMRDAMGGELHTYPGYSHGVLVNDFDDAASIVAEYMDRD
ncbi:alpha/beta fold hydrolase [uncultured Corynebacterium sp.]|uniref:alpha/beta fold hydrolase n=1 Tax=uncultured Corynebacterium sp. TaxID=159447 RepID=UPI0025D9035D|nr:alpha/beta fold hydrolase [uncultured Corynebacterium sp.]